MSAPLLDAARLQLAADTIASDWVKRLGLRVEAASADGVLLSMPVGDEVVHGGGVLCGQAILAAADTALLVAMIAELGGFVPMTTVQLQASFLRPVSKGAPPLVVAARVLKRGKNLCYGEVDFKSADGKLAAHATSTYTLL